MKVVFLPVFRVNVGYLVSVGKRWSVLEHLILVEITRSRLTTKDLAARSCMPERLIIEALINLMRASWIEVRATEDDIFFAPTPTGERLSRQEHLPPSLSSQAKSVLLCSDRLTGAWLRTEDLNLVFESDLPEGAQRLTPLIGTVELTDGRIRDLLPLNSDEFLEPSSPYIRWARRPFARLTIDGSEIVDGLPEDAPIGLIQAICDASISKQGAAFIRPSASPKDKRVQMRDNIKADDIIIGDSNHLQLVKDALESARTTCVIHSCFLSAKTVRLLLPEFVAAAERNVRVDLLWGLQIDPEDPKNRKAILDTQAVLATLTGKSQTRIQLSPISSRSHAKIILYDDKANGKWTTIVSSCNFLSSEFNWVEASIRCRSEQLALELLNCLLMAQITSSESWSATARRLNRVWDVIRARVRQTIDEGNCTLTFLRDQDHYACIRRARDHARSSILVGCDLFGLAAETSVLVPMETAALDGGCAVSLIYSRASERLTEEGKVPNQAALKERGIGIECVEKFHAKVLVSDDDCAVVTSFNWMSTVVEGTRTKGAEFGLMIEGADIGSLFRERLEAALKERSGRI